MDFIVALFMYLGLISHGGEITDAMIDQNKGTIEHYADDQDFLDYYNNTSTTEHIGVIDMHDGD